MGTSLIMVMPGSSSRAGFRGMGTLSLTEEDGMAILAECPSVTQLTPWCGLQGRRSTELVESALRLGMQRKLSAIRACLKRGPVSDHDARLGAKVCVLGKTVATSLFGDLNPVDHVSMLSPLLEFLKKGQFRHGPDQDDMIRCPSRLHETRGSLHSDAEHFSQK
jgi:putative ABC transport system permease protein